MILLAARSGSWNSSRNKIGDVSTSSLAIHSTEYAGSSPPSRGLALRNASSREKTCSMKVLKCQRRLRRVGRPSASRSSSIDLPVPTSPERNSPRGESACSAAWWLVRTRAKARLLVPSRSCGKKRAKSGLRRIGWVGEARERVSWAWVLWWSTALAICWSLARYSCEGV